jgi:hypothetical protein
MFDAEVRFFAPSRIFEAAAQIRGRIAAAMGTARVGLLDTVSAVCTDLGIALLPVGQILRPTLHRPALARSGSET